MENKFALLDPETLDYLKEYKYIEELFKDLCCKAPESFLVGVLDEMVAYSIPRIKEKYKTEYELFMDRHIK